MKPVIKMHGQEDPASSCDLKSEEPNRRFITSTSQLDTLAILQFIKVRDQQDGDLGKYSGHGKYQTIRGRIR
jgi:hypothetical protein